MSQKQEFKSKSADKAADEIHRKKLLRVVDVYDQAVDARKQSQFLNWQNARDIASTVKAEARSRLPDLLEEFEKKISARGAQVLWARTKDEAQKLFLEIAERHHAKLVVKSKTMTSEEIDFNELLEHHKIQAIESDLGEFIQQLAGEKPYHLVTPAMHQTRQQIAEIFRRTLNIPYTDNAEELAMVCRTRLREVYLKADIGVSGANFLIADQGAIVICENEGNARLTVSCPPVHVALVGIEKILPRLADLELFLPLLATSGTGQQITGYNSIIRGPRATGETDGPQHMYVILIDNGRHHVYAHPSLRQSLSCIRCGACLCVCPVYKTIGGHSYSTTYQGPIGSVITPHLKGMKVWNHLSFASSLCGACTDVCPVKIPLHHLLLENRKIVSEQKQQSFFWRVALTIWAHIFSSRKLLNAIGPLLKIGAVLSKLPIPGNPMRYATGPAKKSFAQIWQEHERKK